MSETADTITAKDFQQLFAGGSIDPALHLGNRGATASAWLNEVLEQIDSFSSLPAGWDSYGADSPRGDLLRGARTLIVCLASVGVAARPYVYPARSGGVQFEWERGSRYFEIEIVGEFAATFHYSDAAARKMVSGEVFETERLDDVLTFIRLVELADL